MNSSDSYKHLLEEIEYLVAEQRSLTAHWPTFIVKHSHHIPGTLCLPGEAVEQVCLWENFTEYPLNLAPTTLLLFDCLGRYRSRSLTATKIEEIMLNDPFYLKHGASRKNLRARKIIPRRTTVKVLIRRLREQVAKAVLEAGLKMDSYRVIASAPTDSNIVAYSLRANVDFVHLEIGTHRLMSTPSRAFEKGAQ